jgi:hypothetical protein
VVRYWLLETVRQFAASRLAASSEEAAVHARLLEWALEIARSAEAAPPGPERTSWSGRLSADHSSIRAALAWALGGAEPELGRELAARLARWWIATGRYSEASQFLTAAASVSAMADPGIQARVLLGGAWSAYSRGDNRRTAPLAADGIAYAQQAGEPQLEVWGRNLLAGLAWSAGDADRIVAELEASRVLSGQADPALGARAEVMLANAAFLTGDLAEQDRHGQLAIELARTAVGQEGLALALSAWSMCTIAGLGIQPATVAALDEAANLTTAHPDRFTEMVMRHLRARLFATLGELDAAETEVGLCWAAGQDAVRGVEVLASLAEARLAAARDDIAAAVGALRRAADGGHRAEVVMFVPTALASLACLAAGAGDQPTAAAAVGEARAELGGRRQAIIAAALRYAEGVMAWHRGELADAARLLAAAEAARRPLHYLAPGFTANRDAAARAARQARHVLGDERFTQAWEEGRQLALDDAVAYAARRGGSPHRPSRSWRSCPPGRLARTARSPGRRRLRAPRPPQEQRKRHRARRASPRPPWPDSQARAGSRQRLTPPRDPHSYQHRPRPPNGKHPANIRAPGFFGRLGEARRGWCLFGAIPLGADRQRHNDRLGPPVVRCEWVVISSAAWWASMSQGACPPGTS